MKNLILFLLILLTSSAFSQEVQLSPARTDSYAINADDYVGFDKFGYYYFVRNNALIKAKEKGTVEYKNPALGKITHIDIENPLLLVLFYENFNTIVLLDNQLNEIRKIDFTALNVQIIAHAAGLASQNRLWIYDNLTQQIGLFDYLRNDFRSITTPFQQNLKYYQTDFNTFQWIDEKQNRFACDVFGKVATLETIVDYDAIQFVSDRSTLYAKDGKLYHTNREKNTTVPVLTVENSFKKFYYKDQILSIFTDLGITNYKIILP